MEVIMTTQEKTEFIKSKCIEANPSILDLVFGCKVKAQRWAKSPSKNLIWKEGILIERTHSKEKTNPTAYPYIKFSDGADFAYHDIKIIGREIRLVDVLLAIGKKTKNTWAVESRLGAFLEWGTNSDGVYALYEPAGVDRPVWNLLKDSLQDQSPETIEFIFNLLSA